MQTRDERIHQAQTVGGEDLWQFLKDAHPDVLFHALYNRNVTEDMAIFVAKRRNVSSEVLSLLATDRRFRESYKLKLLICKNPVTPQRVVFSLLKFIRIFDLMDIVKDLNVQVTIRQKIEYMIVERLKSTPSGIQKTLARKANSTLLPAIMACGDESVVRVCLESPSLTEGDVCSIINRSAVSGAVIRLIAADNKWTLHYFVRYALIRNIHAPLVNVVKFLPGMKTSDLRDLYSDPKVPLSTRPFIYRELQERGENVTPECSESYELPVQEDIQISDGSDEV